MLNLYDILLETLDYDRLLEEGRDPVEVLHYKFQNKVPSDIIDKIIAIDPTKKKSDTMWTLQHWNTESKLIQKSLKDGKLKKLFDYFKEHKENQLKDCPTLQKGLDAYIQEDDKGKKIDSVLNKSSEPETYVLMMGEYVPSKLANNFDIVFNQDNWLIAVPNTYEAACKLGENCWWCTSNQFGNGRDWYEKYLRNYGGKYYINFDWSQEQTLNDRTEKTYPYARYQFHFESNQFKAATENEPDVTLDDLNIPQSAIDFYHDINESYDIGEDSEEYYERHRNEDSIEINDDLYLNVETNEGHHYRHPSADDDWLLFSRENGDDEPIIWSPVNPDIRKSIVLNLDNSIIAIKGKVDGYVIAYQTYDGDYEADDCDSVYPLNDFECVAVFDNNFAIYQTNGEVLKFSTRFHNLKDEISNIIENSNFQTENTNFIEIIYKNGFHSLISEEDGYASWIIRYDVPAEGNIFYADEDGVIHGKYKNYSINEENEYGFFKQLTNDLVEVESDNKFNVVSKKRDSLIFSKWYDEIEFNDKFNCFFINDFRTQLIADENGKTIGNEYFRILPIDDNYPNLIECIASNGSFVDLIDLNEKSVFKKFREIDFNHNPINNKIFAITLKDDNEFPNTKKLYDYVDRQFVYKDTLNDKPLYNNNSPFFVSFSTSDNQFHLKRIDNDSFSLKVDNISKLCGDILNITVGDKHNALLPDRIVLPEWCDELLNTMYVQSSNVRTYFILYVNNGKYFCYDTSAKNYLVNPNGIPFKISFDEYANLKITNGEITVTYDILEKKFKKPIGFPMSPKLSAFIAIITGQNPPSNPSSSQAETVASVTESFKQLMKRIDEARKLGHNNNLFG